MSFDKFDLFKREEALILGYMLSKYFTVSKSPGFTGSYGNQYPYEKGEDCEDGSGDWPRGRHGKPPYATANGDLPGSGGNLTSGGWGASIGSFGFGGNGRGYTSSGGGGGWYGGGSGYVKAGGGGGCSYYWLGDVLVTGYMDGVAEYLAEQGVENYNPLFYRGCDIGLLDPLSLDYKAFTQRNMCYGHGSFSIKQVSIGTLARTGQLGYFSVKTGFNISDNGDGTYNVVDTLTGESDTVEEVGLAAEEKYEFQLGYIEYIVPQTGFYLLSGYGAQGGGGSSQQDPSDTAVGGCGAYSQCLFLLKGGTPLKIQIGQYGGSIKAPARPQGGGGGAASNGYGGGGATSVFLEQGNQYSRIFVVGGGGGAGYGNGGESPGLGPSPSGGGESNEPEKEEESFKTDKQMFIISDLSIAYVDINYKTSYDIPEDKSITVHLYVDGVKRGVLTRPAIAGGGFDTWTFDNFDTWLPPNTTPYWATIEAVVETDLEQMVIPIGGLIIRVETKTRPNDATPILRNIFGYVKDKLFAKSYINFFMNQYKNELDELERVRSPIGAKSFIDIFIKVVKKLHNEGLNKIMCQSMVDILIVREEPIDPDTPKLTDLQYVTSNVGAGSYVAFFIKEQEKVVPLDSLSVGGVKSFMEVRIKTVPELRIDTISTVEVENLENIEGV